MPQEQHEEYLTDETPETVEPEEPGEKATERDANEEVAERLAAGADPATNIADVVEQNRPVRHDQDDYRE
ncbi:hypothetical protein ACFRAR_13855 [Kitasatospora sp. NPDC056651]|uniref:hypothetical protein n=1 Tax=Kitasatospora sp. NPDC056651 TaxID=3345892 RepID=UPI00368D5C3B